MPTNWLNLPRQMPVSVNVGSPTSLSLNIAGASYISSTATIGGSNVMLYPVAVTEPYRVRRLWWLNGATINGNVDIGIFDASGAKLVSTGSTAQSGSNNIQSVAVDFTLGIGSYWVGMASDSGTASFSAVSILTAPRTREVWGVAQHVTVGGAIPLPSQLTIGSNMTITFPYFGFSRLASL